MINTIELEVAMKRKKISKKQIAKELKISPMGLYKKMNNITEFKVSEMQKIADILSLNNSLKEIIFFK